MCATLSYDWSRCHHVVHAAFIDSWLRTTVSLPHPILPTALIIVRQQEPLDSRSNNNSRSFYVEISSVYNRHSFTAGDDCRTYSLGSLDYRIEEEVEVVVSCASPRQ